jgi:alkylresorcinol/alkylpyrone synthase
MTNVAEHASRTQTTDRSEPAWGGLEPNRGPRIAGIALAPGARKLDQREVLRRLGLEGDEFAERIFARCGVRERALNLDDEFLASNLQGRTEYVERELFEGAVRASDSLGITPGSIGTVVTSSLYSLGCPTLAHRLMEHYEMDASIDTYHLTGVGCASAVPLMRLAAQSLSFVPHEQALVVAAESMSSILVRGRDGDPRAKTVGSAIFGDGCAAALISSDPEAPGPVIVATQVQHIPDTLGAVHLRADPVESYLHLAKDLPQLAAAGLQGLVAEFLSAQRVTFEAIDHWIVHPGGRRIIETVRDALALSDDDVEASWRVLADHGNVGTPSIFYVLADTLARRRPQGGERGLAITIGPGVTVGLMLLQW